MIIDAHTYLGTWPYWVVNEKTADELYECLSTNGVDKAIVSSLRSIFYNAEEGNQELIKACDKYPESLYGLATLTPFFRREDSGYQALSSGNLKGIKIYPLDHGYGLESASNIFHVAEDFRVPVVIPYRLAMTWSLPNIPVAEAISVARHFHRVTFVLSCFDYGILPSILLREFPKNLYVETSGFQMGIELLTRGLNANHVLLGTALPVQYPQPGIQKVLNAQVNTEELEAIKWKNAAAIFGIKLRLDENLHPPSQLGSY
jgi:predicted TIM-barrel fold metal-dependent hydrolase